MDSVLYFLPLAGVIALVCSGTRHDSIDDIMKASLRIFLYLALGTVAFAVGLQVSLQISFLFYGLLGILLALLAYYTLKEVGAWMTAGDSRDGKAGGNTAF